ncbi:MAG: hypothetical protein M3458_01945 [Acidobacteriota bacterium]|nr:hypothetical protein [Acidobacteriota bacterium]
MLTTVKTSLQTARVIGSCVLGLLLPGVAYALDPEKTLTQYNVSAWSVEDDLPQNTRAPSGRRALLVLGLSSGKLLRN